MECQVRAVIAPHNTGKRNERYKVEEYRGDTERWLQQRKVSTQVLVRLSTLMTTVSMQERGPMCGHQRHKPVKYA